MAKRGFFAELQHQNQVAARKREQAQRAAARQHAAAVRQHEAAQRQTEWALAQAARASTAEQKAATAEAKRLHIAEMEADVESRNSLLAAQYEQLDTLLATTLEVDDFVDLESFRTVPEHPPFPRPDLLNPLPPPPPVMSPPEPQWVEPGPPKGLGGMIGGKKRHEEARQQAWAAHAATHQAWQAHVAQVPTLQLQQMQSHQVGDNERQAQLAVAQQTYDAECATRQATADESNAALDDMLAGLDVGAETAVQEYVTIVLGNSVYPDDFDVRHDFAFDAGLRELTLTVIIPGPEAVPATKAFKFTKSTDEITATDLPQKARKDRYASVVHQVALRTLHEVFEADRRGLIQTLSLTVVAESLDPAVGQMKATPLAAVAVDRARFEPIELAKVVPQATLAHLGALLSKNPLGLVAIDTSKGVRR